MVVVAVKKWCVKNGKRYGPYPKDPDAYYLYRVHRVDGRVVQEYLGRGPKPKGAVDREQLEYLEVLEDAVVQEKSHR